MDDIDDYPVNPVTGGAVLADSDPYHVEPVEPSRTWDDKIQYTRGSFYAGLAGGVLILVGAFVAALFMTALDVMDVAFGDDWLQVALLIGLWGLVTGGAVIVAALRAKERPEHAAVPGLVMVGAGVLSFFALGGFILGGLLAIVGGVLAVAGSRSLWTTRAPRIGSARTGL